MMIQQTYNAHNGYNITTIRMTSILMGVVLTQIIIWRFSAVCLVQFRLDTAQGRYMIYERVLIASCSLRLCLLEMSVW